MTRGQISLEVYRRYQLATKYPSDLENVVFVFYNLKKAKSFKHSEPIICYKNPKRRPFPLTYIMYESPKTVKAWIVGLETYFRRGAALSLTLALNI